MDAEPLFWSLRFRYTNLVRFSLMAHSGFFSPVANNLQEKSHRLVQKNKRVKKTEGDTTEMSHFDTIQ